VGVGVSRLEYPPVSTLEIELHETAGDDPLDLVERLARAQAWPWQREAEDEIAVEIAGQWCAYKLWFAWHAELGVLQLTCGLDLKVPQRRLGALHTLLALANEKLWIGHFELWLEQRLPVFRQAQLFREGQQASAELIEDLIDIAMAECERFYPAFSFVIGGRTPRDALTAAMLETEGEA
jgi:hypothetical protein